MKIRDLYDINEPGFSFLFLPKFMFFPYQNANCILRRPQSTILNILQRVGEASDLLGGVGICHGDSKIFDGLGSNNVQMG